MQLIHLFHWFAQRVAVGFLVVVCHVLEHILEFGSTRVFFGHDGFADCLSLLEINRNHRPGPQVLIYFNCIFGLTLWELVRLVLVFRQHDVSLAFLDGDVVAQSDWHFQTAIMFLHAGCSDEIASRPLVAMLVNQFKRILGNFRWGLR